MNTNKTNLILKAIFVSLLIFSSIIVIDRYDKVLKQEERDKGQLEAYQFTVEEGYCIDGTEYLYSEKYNRGIEVVRFVKCVDELRNIEE